MAWLRRIVLLNQVGTLVQCRPILGRGHDPYGLWVTHGYLRGRGLPMPGIVGRIFGVIALVVVSLGFWERLGTLAIPIGLTVAQAICVVFVLAAMYLASAGQYPEAGNGLEETIG